MAKVSFAPVNFRGLSQQLSHGRKRSVNFCPANYAKKRDVVLPENVGLRVRYIAGGIMYATQVVRSAQKKAKASAHKSPRYGQPVSRPAQQPTAPTWTPPAFLLGNLNADELARRQQALAAARSR